MDINILREKREKLENDIQSSVSMLVETFKKDTGFAPCRISIDIINVSEIADPELQFIVGKCNIDIEI